MAELCPTCASADPKRCGLGALDVGCDHPSVAAEMDALLRSVIGGSMLAKHRRNYDRWRRAWFADPAHD